MRLLVTTTITAVTNTTHLLIIISNDDSIIIRFFQSPTTACILCLRFELICLKVKYLTTAAPQLCVKLRQLIGNFKVHTMTPNFTIIIIKITLSNSIITSVCSRAKWYFTGTERKDFIFYQIRVHGFRSRLWETLLRLNWCDSGGWRYQYNSSWWDQ